MSALTLFPARIRFVNADGTLTPEALRMLELLVGRVGGTVGDLGDDVHAAPQAEPAPLVDVGQPVQPQPDLADVVGQVAPADAGLPEMIMQQPPARADQVEGLGSMARQNIGTSFDGSFTGKTVTVTNGIITKVV